MRSCNARMQTSGARKNCAGDGEIDDVLEQTQETLEQCSNLHYVFFLSLFIFLYKLQVIIIDQNIC